MSQNQRVVAGVDSAKDRVDIVILEDGAYVEHHSFDTPKEMREQRGRSLQFLRDKTEQAFSTWGYDLDVVFIEENIVRGSLRTAVVLGQTVGMLLALPYRCETVIIQHWKMGAVGNGGATKEQVRAGIVRRMPATEQLYGKRQDLFDATGVAIYGDAVLRRRLRP